MTPQEWPAEDYATGSYIQATVADAFIPMLDIPQDARVLDVGCGNGAYTRKILAMVPHGSVLGVDVSANMLKLAQDVVRDFPNLSLLRANIQALDLPAEFDMAVSFWCLQWISDIRQAFACILQALKPGGRVFALFPAGDDPFILGYRAMRDSGQFSVLDTFVPPMDYAHLDNLAGKLQSLSWKQVNVEVCRHNILLPSLDTYRKFVNGIAFYQGQLPDTQIRALNAAMVDYYDSECQRQYGGEYRFVFSLYLVKGEKKGP